MNPRIVKNLDLLKILSKSNSPKLRRAILQHCDIDLIKCLAEIAHNILEGRLKLTQKQSGKLRTFRKTLRQLAERRTKLPIKRNLLVRQSGAGLPLALLAPIVGVALSLLADRLAK